MNLVTLCPTCHALAHGMNLIGVDYTQEDVEQCIVEYLADYYAGLGYRWPDGEPISIPGVGEWAEAIDEWAASVIDEVRGLYGKGGET